MSVNNPYDSRYSGKEYYWGTKPSTLCDRLIEIVKPSLEAVPRLIDLGCGEGRNAVYLARHGFNVTGLDASLNGLEKTRRMADEAGVDVDTVQADIIPHLLSETWDVIFSTGTLQFLPAELRPERFEHYKRHTRPGGWQAISVLVYKPFIPAAPDADNTAQLFRSGELLGYYWDWEILYSIEEIFDCNSSGKPHQHAVNRVIARKPQESASA